MGRSISILTVSACLAFGSANAAPDANPAATTPPAPGYQTVTPSITLHHISPVEYFRGILGMTPAQRERALALKSPDERRAILLKVKEYESLPREVREARLRQTDLHWRLITLMRMDTEERDQQLKTISPLDLPMIAEQLRRWDKLPETTRQALLGNDRYMQTYVSWQVSARAGQDEIPRWLPLARRTYLATQVKLFQTQAVNPLSPDERQQMEQSLQTYADLAPAQRQQCIDSFGKFAAMDPRERAQFLQNAEKWESMSPHERQLWRTLVGELPPSPPAPAGMPPMPPGFGPYPPAPGQTPPK